MMRRILLILFVVVAGLYANAQSQFNKDYCSAQPIHFTWGVEFAGNVDMTRNNMSSVGFDAYFGMRTVGVNVLGTGVGINIPVANSLKSYPVFVICRTNFSSRPTLLFADLRAGVSVNYINDNRSQAGSYASAGIGINLARSRKFASHLTLAYTFFERKNYLDTEQTLVKVPSLHLATIRLGVTF